VPILTDMEKRKSFVSDGIRTANHPARNKSLYFLRCPKHPGFIIGADFFDRVTWQEGLVSISLVALFLGQVVYVLVL